MEKPQNDARATKKQKELLSFIDGFVKGNGYGPSYREIMRALEYKSVSTVATHVNGLIGKGYLKKSGTSARSLEVVQHKSRNDNEVWLANRLKHYREKLSASESSGDKHTVEAIDIVAKLFGISL